MPPRSIPEDLRPSGEEPTRHAYVKLPEFEGKPSEDVEEWLFSLQLHFDAHDTAAHKRVKLAAASLRGTALTWWRFQVLSKEDAAPTTWDDFADALTAAFQPINPAKTARDKLANLRQTTSVAAYAHSFRNLALHIPDLHDAEKLDRFIRGLKPNTQRELAIRAPPTFEDAVNMADRYDTLVYNQQRLHRRSTDPPHRRSDAGADGAVRVKLAAINANETKTYTKLTPELRAQLAKEGKCFYCRIAGHTAANCPSKPPQSFPNAPRQ